MGNIIAEKYLNYRDRTPEEVSKIVAQAIELADFEVASELWRGHIYSKAKTGSVILAGRWRSTKAVLKIQLLPIEHEEAALIEAFMAQNKSPIIRAPKIYSNQPFNSELGFGFMVMESVEAASVYEAPFADALARRRYVEFLKEFYARAVVKPFLEPKEERERSTEVFLLKRLDAWEAGNARAPEARRLPKVKQERLLAKFRKLIKTYAPSLPMKFTHGHLGPNDIRVQDEEHILLANIFWSYRPTYYNLGFNVWCELMAMYRLPRISLKLAQKIVDDWGEAYRALPEAINDPDFDRGYRFMVLERCMGSVLMDLVVAERIQEAEAKRAIQLEVLAELAEMLIERLGG